MIEEKRSDIGLFLFTLEFSYYLILYQRILKKSASFKRRNIIKTSSKT